MDNFFSLDVLFLLLMTGCIGCMIAMLHSMMEKVLKQVHYLCDLIESSNVKVGHFVFKCDSQEEHDV